MRALVVALALAAAACGGGGADSSSGGASDDTTGLVLAIHYDDYHVDHLVIRGAVAMSGREFGPFVVSADDLRPGDTIGLVFDADDAGGAMVCADARDRDDDVRASDCDDFDIRAAQVLHDDSTLHSR